MDKIPVGISSCLAGQPVRHDGGHRHSRYCTETLGEYFSLHPFCPENGAGMPTPRPAMHLVEHGDALRLEVIRSGEDVTDALLDWNRRVSPELAHLRGFVLTAKSPSCGLERIRVYNEAGQVQHRQGVGLFAAHLLAQFPLMPVEDDGRLQDPAIRENFLERVFVYDDWCRLREEGLTAAGLLDFHTRHKMQLLAHCQATYRRLGPMLSDLRNCDLQALALTYITEVMAALRKHISRGAHVNVMLHLLGYFRGKIDAVERQSIQSSVDAYRQGHLPLIVPMTLIRHLQERFPHEYLQQQEYLAPYPDELGLRNRL